MWSLVAVGVRPTIPLPEIGLQGFSLLFTHCWVVLAEHRPGVDLVLQWVEALKHTSITKPLGTLRRS